jgi:hypothetical protein
VIIITTRGNGIQGKEEQEEGMQRRKSDENTKDK